MRGMVPGVSVENRKPTVAYGLYNTGVKAGLEASPHPCDPGHQTQNTF
jgi:hypothetical protein